MPARAFRIPFRPGRLRLSAGREFAPGFRSRGGSGEKDAPR